MILFTAVISAQSELGVRLGNVSGGNAAVDGIISLSQFSRIHADISFGDGMGIDALWDFAYRPFGDEALNWYAGVGPYAQIGSNVFNLGVAGELGLEYRFKFPVSVSADWRPMFQIIDNTSLDFGGFGVNIRYVIN